MTARKDAAERVAPLSAEELRILDGWRPFVPNLGVLLAEHATLRAKLTEAERERADEQSEHAITREQLRVATEQRDAATARAAEAERLLKTVLDVGRPMATLCFNWAQERRFTEREREMLKSMQERWDEARAAARSHLQSLKAKEPTDGH